MRLTLKVTAGAKREGINSWRGEQLKLSVRAPAEKGKANLAVINLLAKQLSLPAQQIQIIHGKTSPQKVVEISGLSEAEILQKLKC